MQEEEEDETAPHSPVSSAPPAAQGVAMSASSLSENPVFKRARGEKVLVGAKATPGADEGPSSRPISQAELEQRFYMQADGADSVVDDDLGGHDVARCSLGSRWLQGHAAVHIVHWLLDRQP